jgi:hypothetical protein
MHPTAGSNAKLFVDTYVRTPENTKLLQIGSPDMIP